MVSTLRFGAPSNPAPVGQWRYPAGYYWWLKLPTVATPRQFRFIKRVLGPIQARDGRKLGFFARLTYEWFWTDDPYFVRVDEELRAKGL